MVTMCFPGQTATGIEDAEAFFLLCNKVLYLSSVLRQVIQHLGPQSELVGHFNCEVVTRVVAQVLPAYYGVIVIDGHFGAIKKTESMLAQYEHSWLYAPSAPSWVIDVAPFNGLLAPCIVQAQDFPWCGIYRPGNGSRTMSPHREKFIGDMVRFLQSIEASSAA